MGCIPTAIAIGFANVRAVGRSDIWLHLLSDYVSSAIFVICATRETLGVPNPAAIANISVHNLLIKNRRKLLCESLVVQNSFVCIEYDNFPTINISIK